MWSCVSVDQSGAVDGQLSVSVGTNVCQVGGGQNAIMATSASDNTSGTITISSTFVIIVLYNDLEGNNFL